MAEDKTLRDIDWDNLIKEVKSLSAYDREQFRKKELGLDYDKIVDIIY